MPLHPLISSPGYHILFTALLKCCQDIGYRHNVTLCELNEKVIKAALDLPLTLTSAVVFWSPTMQLYSPTSTGRTFLMCNSATNPSCLILYLVPLLSSSSPLSHVTGTPALDNSQCKITTPPSGASWFFRFCLNVTGVAEE